MVEKYFVANVQIAETGIDNYIMKQCFFVWEDVAVKNVFVSRICLFLFSYTTLSPNDINGYYYLF